MAALTEEVRSQNRTNNKRITPKVGGHGKLHSRESVFNGKREEGTLDSKLSRLHEGTCSAAPQSGLERFRHVPKWYCSRRAYSATTWQLKENGPHWRMHCGCLPLGYRNRERRTGAQGRRSQV